MKPLVPFTEKINGAPYTVRRITPTDPMEDFTFVMSAQRHRGIYIVTPEACTCPNATVKAENARRHGTRMQPCKHMRKAREIRHRERMRWLDELVYENTRRRVS